MSITTIRLLQLGDVHFPDAQGQKPALDVKDPALDGDFVARLASTPFQSVIRNLQRWIAEGSCDAVLIMGDLTSKGDKESFVRCLDYLQTNLWNSVDSKTTGNSVLVVPGNHDINRADARRGIAEKFEYINSALLARGLRPTEIDTCPTWSINKGPVTVVIYAANTCIGCGSFRNFPDAVRSRLEEHYDRLLADTSDPDEKNEIYEQLYEQLDAPAISHEQITDIVSSSRSAGLSVICGHHNLLPQALTRVAPYTELVNAGALRETLLETKRDVIYLHGHTHTDPIDIVVRGDGVSKLISIGAPELSAGFNLLEIDFSKTGVALGCRVTAFRIDSGVLKQTKTTELSLSAAVSSSAKHEELLRLVHEGRAIYWWQAADALQLSDTEIEEIATELMWGKQISIRKSTGDRRSWRFERAY